MIELERIATEVGKIMDKRIVPILYVGAAIGSFAIANVIWDKTASLEMKEPTTIEVVTENHMIRRVYTPHRSLIKQVAWYDRTVEDYFKNENGEFVLRRVEETEYDYPNPLLGENETKYKTNIKILI
nr:hypothetical protein [Nanoarchaeum sp.]